MKKYFPLMFIGMSLIIGACSDSNDMKEVVGPIVTEPEVVAPNPSADINKFIWEAMNDLYLWKDDRHNLISKKEKEQSFLKTSLKKQVS